MAVLLTNTTAFLVEWLHTIQSPVTGTAAVVMRGRPGPSNGIYQHHDEVLAAGLRAESDRQPAQRVHRRHLDGWRHRAAARDDSNVTGVHDVTAENLFGQQRQPCGRALAPLRGLDHLSIRHLFSISMIDGIRLAATSAQDRNPPPPASFATALPPATRDTSPRRPITDDASSSGTNAEQNYSSDVYHEDPPRTTSENVISNVSTAGTDVTIAGIGCTSPPRRSARHRIAGRRLRPVLGEHRAERLARILRLPRRRFGTDP